MYKEVDNGKVQGKPDGSTGISQIGRNEDVICGNSGKVK